MQKKNCCTTSVYCNIPLLTDIVKRKSTAFERLENRYKNHNNKQVTKNPFPAHLLPFWCRFAALICGLDPDRKLIPSNHIPQNQKRKTGFNFH